MGEPKTSGRIYLETWTNSIELQEVVTPDSPSKNLQGPASEQRGQKQDVAIGQNDRLIPSVIDATRDVSASRASSTTRVDTYDDGADAGATHQEAFATIYYIDMFKSNVCNIQQVISKRGADNP